MKLDLSDNELYYVKGLVELLDNLLSTIQVLSLSYNRFGDGLVELVHHVQRFHRLRRLGARDFFVSEVVREGIKKQLKQTLPDLEELEI